MSSNSLLKNVCKPNDRIIDGIILHTIANYCQSRHQDLMEKYDLKSFVEDRERRHRYDYAKVFGRKDASRKENAYEMGSTSQEEDAPIKKAGRASSLYQSVSAQTCETLALEPQDDFEAAKAKYRRIIKEAHPDHGGRAESGGKA